MHKGFTLPEILITLGVIGVVSAITLPIIHSKFQDYILKNRFKKVYNTYVSAIQMMNNENGDVYDCYYESVNTNWNECPSFYNKLAKKLKYVKYCSKNAYTNGCIPEYSKYNPENSSMCPGFKKTIVETKSKAWILSDGSLMFTYNKGTAPVFAVDINGLKGPNKGGYDLFVFQIIKKGNSIIFGSACEEQFLDIGGKTLEQMLLN